MEKESGMFCNLCSDARRYSVYGGWWRSLGFWVGATYRAGHAAHSVRIPGFRQLLILISWILKLPFRLLFHVEIKSVTSIGPGLLMIHPYNILVGENVEIGCECSIFHEVTLASGASPSLLKIGDHVVVFPGARILGGVTIGERSEIGANCVVTKDVAPYMIVVPPVARAIPQDLLRNKQSEDDPPPRG